jgi:hypothetical protein
VGRPQARRPQARRAAAWAAAWAGWGGRVAAAAAPCLPHGTCRGTGPGAAGGRRQLASGEADAPRRLGPPAPAGLPIIATLQHLIGSGDRIERIEGIFSGTLSYIFNNFGTGAPCWRDAGGRRRSLLRWPLHVPGPTLPPGSQAACCLPGALLCSARCLTGCPRPACPALHGADARSFSEVVSEAKAAGYTEPDPRDDLAGMDVARKVTILARWVAPARRAGLCTPLPLEGCLLPSEVPCSAWLGTRGGGRTTRASCAPRPSCALRACWEARRLFALPAQHTLLPRDCGPALHTLQPSPCCCCLSVGRSECGMSVELGDVPVRSLVPAPLQSVESAEEYMQVGACLAAVVGKQAHGGLRASAQEHGRQHHSLLGTWQLVLAASPGTGACLRTCPPPPQIHTTAAAA